MQSQLQVFLLPTNFKSDTITPHKHGLQSTVQNGCLQACSFKTNFFSIAGTLGTETSVSEKAECLLAIGEDKKKLNKFSKLFGVTSFKKS